ncbi:MAG: radical SAM protein [Candidatus Omnitrophota bacterium]
MRLIKTSTSLSAFTLQEVSCRIYEDEGRVFLNKDDSPGERHLIEKAPSFYKKMDVDYGSISQGFDRIMVDVTTRCNLHCSVCYRKLNSREDVPLATLREFAAGCRGKIISLCGGEPTMRDDLPEIIRSFGRRNAVFLITNGIKLADFDYAYKLKMSGLRYVSFSLSGFSEGTLGRINEAGLLSAKLKALGNLKRLKIKTVLAAVLIKGVNDKELKDIFDFCLDNRDFIYELRVRAMAPLGAHLDYERMCISQMLDTVSGELGIDKGDILGEFELKREANVLFRREIFNIKSCTFDFHLKLRKNGFSPVWNKSFSVHPRAYHPLLRKASVFLRLMKVFGAATVLRGALKKVFKIDFLPWIYPKNIFKVGLRSWPDINTIDLQENYRCRTGYWLDGTLVSFCRANIIRDGFKNDR